MRFLRWACLALFVFGLTSSGCGPTDPSKDPAAAPALKARADKIEQYKAQAAKFARKPKR